jgi:phosphate acetyltransferase
MTILEKIRTRAKANPQRLVFPEGEDVRVIESAAEIHRQGFAEPTLIGKQDTIERIAEKQGTDLSGITVLQPNQDEMIDQLADFYFEKRRHKGLTVKEAREYTRDPVAFGALMVSRGMVDGYVAGAVRTTGDTVRAGIRCVGLRTGISTVSSFFIMVLSDSAWGVDGALMYADCAVVPDPSPEQLADIAISTAENTRIYLEADPKLAILSFSTRGSARHLAVEKVTRVIGILKEKKVNFEFDGELQVDAALIPGVAKRKAPDSCLEGRANTLIFPNLDAGNIAYKITQRLAGAQAIGPVLQGLAKPLNDLSRGCSVEDIINVAAITALQAAEGKKRQWQ